VTGQDFFRSLYYSPACVGIMGIIGGLIVGGMTALFSGPVAVAAAVGAGLFGVFGAALAALDTGTSGQGHCGVTWAVGLPAAALLAFGVYSALANSPHQTMPPKQTTALSQTIDLSRTFNAVSPAIRPELQLNLDATIRTARPPQAQKTPAVVRFG
jgi:hypothetical protein